MEVFYTFMIVGTILSLGQCDTGVEDELSLENLKKWCYTRDHDKDRHTVVATVHVNNTAVFLQNLPRDTRKLHLTVKTWVKSGKYGYRHIPPDLPLNITEIQFLDLEELWITQQSIYPSHSEPFGEYYKHIWLSYEIINPNPLRLKQIHLELKMRKSTGLISLLSHAKQLEVLDLFRTSQLNTNGSLSLVLASLENKPLRVLRLDKFQSTSGYENRYNTTLDPLQLLYPLRNSPLQCLTLAQNDLIYLSPGISVVAPQLRIIDLSRNNIFSASNTPALFEIFLHPHLEVVTLDIEGTFQESIRAKRSSNQSRHMHSKFHSCMEKCGMSSMIELAFNKTLFCDMMKCVADHRLTDLPCKLLPSFEDITKHIDFNCDPPFHIPLLKHHKEISIQFAETWVQSNKPMEAKNFCFAENELRHFAFSHSPLLASTVFWADMMKYYSVSGFALLEHLDFSYNDLPISLDMKKNALLRSLTGLKKLYLQGNQLSFSPSSTESFCDILQQIASLDLSHSKISKLPADIFHNCHNLQELNLAGNELSDLSSLDKKTGIQLQSLNLSHNEIQIGSSFLIDKVYTSHMKTLDLSGNQFTCDCMSSSIQTIEFIQSHLHLIDFVGKEDYLCTSGRFLGQKLLDIDLDLMKRECLLICPIFLTAMIITILMVAIVIAAVLYRYRYRLLFCYYKFIFRCCKAYRKDYKYDVYLSSCAEERFFIQNTLIKQLEERCGFKLCINMRDFMIGENTDDEISHCMSLSHVTMVILSDQYINSTRGVNELQKAYSEHLNSSKPLIVIKVGNIKTPRKDLPGIAQQILDNHVYEEWPKSTSSNLESLHVIQKKQERFWEKIVAELYKHISENYKIGCSCSCYRRKTPDCSGFAEDYDDDLLDLGKENYGLGYVD